MQVLQIKSNIQNAINSLYCLYTPCSLQSELSEEEINFNYKYYNFQLEILGD